MSANDIIDKFYAPPDKVGQSSLDGLVSEQLGSALEKLFGQLEMLSEAEGKVTPLPGAQPPGGAAEQEATGLPIPKLRPTERGFGKPGSVDRIQLEMFSKNIKGHGLKAKITYLDKILKGERQPGLSIAESLSTMVILELLITIMQDFTESAGGFIFEAFIAGLVGGKSIQVATPEEFYQDLGEPGTQKGKPITDVILGDDSNHYSLKLLSKGTELKGSIANMQETLKVLKGKPLYYLVAERDKENLILKRFALTKETFSQFGKIGKQKGKEGEEVDKYGEFLTADGLQGLRDIDPDKIDPISQEDEKIIAAHTAGLFVRDGESVKLITTFNVRDPVSGKKLRFAMSKTQLREVNEDATDELETYLQAARKEGQLVVNPGILKKLFYAFEKRGDEVTDIQFRRIVTPSEKLKKGETQFKLSRRQVLTAADTEEIATIRVDRQAFQAAWQQVGEGFRQDVAPIYRAFNLFHNHINSYFAEQNKEAVKKAETQADTLQEETTKLVKAEEGRKDTQLAATA
jgi:hypothetical protein